MQIVDMGHRTLYYVPVMKNSQLRIRRPVVLAAAFVLGFIVLLISVLSYKVEAQSRVDEAQHVDALLVLGSAVWPGERPSPSLAARTRHAIALFKAGYADHVILCGGLGKNPPTEAEAMRRIMAAAGIPNEALVLEDTSHSTEENLEHAKQIMQERGWTTALIVSDPFHLLRAKIIASDMGMVAFASPADDSPTYTDPVMRTWYTLREAAAVVWYYGTRTLGEPEWLYQLLKNSQTNP